MVAFLACAVAAAALMSHAQQVLPVADELKQSRTLNEAKREATIGANMDFTTEQKSRFWPLYWEYRAKVQKIDDAYISVLQKYFDSYQSLTDSQARTLIDDWLQIEADRLDLKKQYVEKFEAALSAAKALRVMQIENKLDTMLDASVGKQIPLAVPDS
jgi:hypothetical protein